MADPSAPPVVLLVNRSLPVQGRLAQVAGAPILDRGEFLKRCGDGEGLVGLTGKHQHSCVRTRGRDLLVLLPQGVQRTAVAGCAELSYRDAGEHDDWDGLLLRSHNPGVAP